jgi:molybdate transport system substrate-binding protein
LTADDTDAGQPGASRDDAIVRGISSMAVARLLAELCAHGAARIGIRARVESVGGVDAARRVAAGEAFDFVVLAEDAIDALAGDGRVDAASRVTVARSAMAMAVAPGVAVPRIDTADAVREALLAAPRIAYSTGPSGRHLLALVARWDMVESVAAKLVQAPPGVGVASLLARGDAALGFQQMSELIGVEGVTVAGPLPAAIEAITPFCGAVCTVSAQAERARVLLRWLASDEAAAARTRLGFAA